MTFDYNEYYDSLVTSSLIFILISIIILIIGCLLYFKGNMFSKAKQFKKNNQFLFSIIISSFLIAILGVSTTNFNLMFEDENDKTIEVGVISDIKGVKNPPKFTYHNTPVTPKLITINETDYYIMYIGEFEMDDEVIIEYLPKSKIVLSIEYTNDD